MHEIQAQKEKIEKEIKEIQNTISEGGVKKEESEYEYEEEDNEFEREEEKIE